MKALPIPKCPIGLVFVYKTLDSQYMIVCRIHQTSVLIEEDSHPSEINIDTGRFENQQQYSEYKYDGLHAARINYKLQASYVTSSRVCWEMRSADAQRKIYRIVHSNFSPQPIIETGIYKHAVGSWIAIKCNWAQDKDVLSPRPREPL